MNIESAVLAAGETKDNSLLIEQLHRAGVRSAAIFSLLERIEEDEKDCGSLDEWVKRPSFSRGRMLLEHRTIFRALGLEDPSAQLLGHGSFGAAYEVPLLNRSVIKLTRDPYESIASFDLLGKKTKYTVPIFGVWMLENSFYGIEDDSDDLMPWYVIHRAYLEPLDETASATMNILYDIYHDESRDMKIPQSHHRGMRTKWEEAIKWKIEEKSLSPRLFPRAMLMLDHVGVAIRELHDIGIDWFDFHASNMMKDSAGTIRIADVGWGVMHRDTTREVPFLTMEAAQEHIAVLSRS